VSGIGIDVEQVGTMSADAEGIAFTSEERAVLASLAETEQDEWSLRFWCAKEAVAKALGLGMIDGPQALVVKEVNADQGTMRVGLSGVSSRRFSGGDTRLVTAHTVREESLVVATALHLSEGEG
jgi:phosphopantetheine--protein transferase-like protein